MKEYMVKVTFKDSYSYKQNVIAADSEEAFKEVMTVLDGSWLVESVDNNGVRTIFRDVNLVSKVDVLEV